MPRRILVITVSDNSVNIAAFSGGQLSSATLPGNELIVDEVTGRYAMILSYGYANIGYYAYNMSNVLTYYPGYTTVTFAVTINKPDGNQIAERHPCSN